MIQIALVALVWLPYVTIGKALKVAKDYCKKRNWIFAEETLNVLGLPFSLYDDVAY